MSLTSGLIAIKGQYLDSLNDVFSSFKLIDTKNDTILNNWAQVAELMDAEYMNPQDRSQQRVVWFDNGWTIIEDLSLILCSDDSALEKLSQKLNTPVFSLITQGTSGNYGFWYFDSATQRSFLNDNGNIVVNSGGPLIQETNFKINENASYDDIHGVAKALGINWDNAEKLSKFFVKRIVNSGELNRELEQAMKNYKPKLPENSTHKPWWKIW
jgi:hypothetical protein